MENENILTKHTTKSWFKSAILGLFIGLAVIIPGVSGAQIAILFKLYDKVTYALSNIFKKFKLCILFLLPILIGGLIGFVAGFFGIKELLEYSTFVIVCFFAGMMLGGTPVLYKEVKGSKITPLKIILLILGLAIPISISAIAVNSNLNLENELLNLPWWMYVIALPVGFIVAITQLVPGLSATSTLMSIGLFKPLMASVSMTYWKQNPKVFIIYVLLGIGFLVGVFLLSKGITKFIEKSKSTFYYLSLGLSISSIASMFYNPEIVDSYNNFKDPNYGTTTLEISLGISLLIVGFIAIILLLYFSEKKSRNSIDNSVNE